MAVTITPGERFAHTLYRVLKEQGAIAERYAVTYLDKRQQVGECRKVTVRKNGQKALLHVTGRELRMNNTDEQMRLLVEAKAAAALKNLGRAQ